MLTFLIQSAWTSYIYNNPGGLITYNDKLVKKWLIEALLNY